MFGLQSPILFWWWMLSLWSKIIYLTVVYIYILPVAVFTRNLKNTSKKTISSSRVSLLCYPMDGETAFDWEQGALMLHVPSLLPMQEKSGRSDWSGDVFGHMFEAWLHISTYSPTRIVMWWIHDHAHCMGEWVEICNCTSNHFRLHHQINLAFPIFSCTLEKHKKAWLRG